MSLRLRLCIQRFSTPEVNSLWVVDLTDDLTVAKLLGQINDVFTLETAHWGLEDYVVELAGEGGQRGYECLHFHKVGKVFKDMDEVLIRSLLTDDLRQRRLSGRHQISSDGKHLVDGLAFGRPWLRPPRDRPLIDLPPRKRAKLLSGQDEQGNVPEQLLLEGTDLIDQENENGSESEDDGDFVPAAIESQALLREESDDEDLEELAEDSEDDLDAELALLRADNAIVQDGALSELNEEAIPEYGLLSPHALSEDEFSGFPDSSPFRAPPHDREDLLDRTGRLSFAEKVELLRKAWPYHPTGSIKGALASSRENVRQAYNTLLQTGEAECAYADLVVDAITINRSSSLRHKHSGASALPLHNNIGSADEEDGSVFTGFSPAKPPSSRPLIQEVEIFEDPESPTPGPSGASINPNTVEEESDETSSSGSDSDSDSDADGDFAASDGDSSDEESSGSEASDAEPPAQEVTTPVALATETDESGSSSDSSSDVSSSSESSGPVSPQQGELPRSLALDESLDSDSVSSDSSSDSDSDSESISSSPEEKSSKPQPKPAPSHSLPHQAETSKLPASLPQGGQTTAPGDGLSKTQKRNARRRTLRQVKMEAARQEAVKAMENGNKPETSLAQQFLARKQALLDAVQDPDHEEPAAAPIVSDKQHKTNAELSAAASQSSPQAESSKKKSRFDLSAGRRMLFGSLGLKAPKSKEDEDKLKEKLMEGVRPLKNHRVEPEPAAAAESENIAQAEDPNAWKDKINYRAVECCHEGITLSEPPFPFRQRWDPQQNFSSMRKRKRQSQEYHYDDYRYQENYDDGQDWGEEEGTIQEPAPKKKRRGKKTKDKEEIQGPDVLNYDDVPHQPVATESQFTDMDDLPSLPADLASLTGLELGAVKPGMVITWKQLQMNKSTNWQPQQVSMTALVVSGVDTATNILHVILAKRDRDVVDAEYDETTGKRIYGMFEMPQDEDEEDQEDDGHRDMDWTDLMDVRLVQMEPSPSTFTSPAKEKSVASDLLESVEKDGISLSASDQREPVLQSQGQFPASSRMGLDTQAVMAEVQADLGHPAESTESTSIQSGQHVPPEAQMPEEVVISYSTDNGEPKDAGDLETDEAKIQEKENFDDVLDSDGSNSPTRQLDEDSQIYLGVASPLVTANTGEHSGEQTAHSPLEPPFQEDDEPLLMFDDEPEIPFFDDNVPDGSNGEPPVSRPHRETPLVTHSNLTVPSSVASPRSGRQPEDEYPLSVSNGVHTTEESVIPETVPRAQESLPTHMEQNDGSVSEATLTSPKKETPKIKGPTRNFPDSSSPLASLDEIFHTAATSRVTQSPSRSTQQSVLASRSFSSKPDLEYEEAMRRFDEGEDSDFSPDRNKSIRGLFPNATQPAPDTSSAKLDADDSLMGFDSNDLDGFEIRDSTNPPSKSRSNKAASRGASKAQQSSPVPTRSRKRGAKTEKRFVLPEGSQVISLDSSPAPSEKYADDDLDGDWGGENDGVDGEDRATPSRKGGSASKKGKANSKPRRASGSLPKGSGGAKKGNGQSTTGASPTSPARRSMRRSSSRV